MRNIKILFFLMICFASSITAQTERVKLSNPSFEDMPRHSQAPMGWYDCGMDGESPPDVQPGVFEVKHRAHDGMTYLGLVTRDNETWEAVGQRLVTPLEGGNCYQFNIFLTYSDEYFSISRTTLKKEFFIKPVLLRIWAGNGYCDKRELLGESDLVDNTEWKEHQFIIKPKRDYKYIVFEAFYKTPTLFPYNGNLLVDRASDFVLRTDCDEEEEPEWIAELMPEGDDNGPLAVNDKPKKPKEPVDETPDDPNRPPDPTEIPTNIITEVEVPKTLATDPKIMKVFANPDDIKEGQSITIQQLDFEADNSDLTEKMFPVLDEIYDFMEKNPRVIIEIGGHTNGLPSHEYCNWLSKGRASAVRDYLVKHGLDKSRLSFKGYGKTLPIDTNSTAAGRKKNQRVEIKFLSLKG